MDMDIRTGVVQTAAELSSMNTGSRRTAGIRQGAVLYPLCLHIYVHRRRLKKLDNEYSRTSMARTPL